MAIAVFTSDKGTSPDVTFMTRSSRGVNAVSSTSREVAPVRRPRLEVALDEQVLGARADELIVRVYTVVASVICSVAGLQPVAARSLEGTVGLQIRQGRPVVDGVYLNGHGPYRFLVDTGTTLSHVDPRLAQAIGLTSTFTTEVRTATGRTQASGTSGVEVVLGPGWAERQTFLFVGLVVLHQPSSDIDGVLGQEFLTHFDYTLDMRAKQMTFGTIEMARTRTRVPFQLVEGRPVVATSLGPLVLDSGASLMVRFTLPTTVPTRELVTASGRVAVGTIASALVIEGHLVWHGDAVAVPRPAESGAAGLLPSSVFRSVYVCNSERYLVFN
jgi:predicted aspartyl protease